MTGEAALTSPFCLVTTTCETEASARSLATILLTAHLAACVQIMPVRSLYSWQGELRDEAEALLLIKAKSADWPALEAAIRAAHSYEVPEILAFEIAAGHAPYLAWIAESTAPRG
ncbi:MAG TPA: divalent-cation tolerance protein CutA [Beijerinckiaceae bacterium]|nr:divalent-cation tolerance protein CutA [Beijerinckiaceae bacterium]